MRVACTTCEAEACVCAQRDALAAASAPLGSDELRVLTAIASRLELGRRQYGALNIAIDRRDWRREAREEALDLSVYLALDLLGTST